MTPSGSGQVASRDPRGARRPARAMPASSTSWWVTNRTVSTSMVPAQHAVGREARRADRPGARRRARRRCWSRRPRGRRCPGTAPPARRRARGRARGRRPGARPSSRAPRSPAAAITPAWRIWPPSRDRCARASSMTARDPHSSEPTGALSPFDRQNIVVSVPARRARSARRSSAIAAFQMRAPSQCTASPCSRATAVTASSSAVAPRPPARRHVRVLDAQRGDRRGDGGAAAPRRAPRRRRCSVPSPSGERAQLHAGVRRRRPRARSGTRARARRRAPRCRARPSDAQRELVRHRARRHVQRRLLAEQRRRQRLQPADGRVLAVGVVTDLGVGHGPAHLRRRPW